MAKTDSTPPSTGLTDSQVDKLQPKEKIYTLADPVCSGLHVRVEKSGSKSWWLNVWTPNDAPKRQRYSWRLGDVSTFKLYKKTPSSKPDRDRSIRDYAEVVRANALTVDLRVQKRAATAKNETDKTATLQGYINLVYSDVYAEENARPKEMMKWLKSSFADLLPMKLESISHLTIRDWRKKEFAKPKKPSVATIARKLQLLSGVLSHARDVGKLISVHPLQKSELKAHKLKIETPDNSRVRFLDVDEEINLRNALKERDTSMKVARVRTIEHRQERGLKPPQSITGAYADHLTPLVLLALNTGIRRGALLGLKWSDIKQGQIFVSAKLDKAGKGYSVPLSDEATEVLRLWKHQVGDKGLVFTHRGHAIKSIKTSWLNLMTEAKITDFRFHDLRHHFASRLVMSGVDLYTVARLMGHSSIDMTKRYAHLSPDHLKTSCLTN